MFSYNQEEINCNITPPLSDTYLWFALLLRSWLSVIISIANSILINWRIIFTHNEAFSRESPAGCQVPASQWLKQFCTTS